MTAPSDTDAPKTLMDFNLPAKGRRPFFFDDPSVDKLLAILMAVAGELSVTRERLDTVERILARRGGLTREEIEEFQPSEDERAERSEMRNEYVARILRILQVELDNLDRDAADAAYDKTVEELSKS